MMEQALVIENQSETGFSPKDKSDRKWPVLLLIVLLLLFSLGALVVSVQERTSYFGRAAGPSSSTGEAVLENSYLFASPLTAMANGKERIRVTIFILDSQGRGVGGKTVYLGQNEKLVTSSIQAVTDNLGRSIFDITSSTSGEYYLEAGVDNQVLPNRVKVSFR